MKPLKEKINCQISSVKHPIGTVYLKKTSTENHHGFLIKPNDPRHISLHPGVSPVGRSPPLATAPERPTKKNSSSHGFWLVMSSLVWDQGLQSCVYIYAAIYVLIYYIHLYVHTYHLKNLVGKAVQKKKQWLEPNNEIDFPQFIQGLSHHWSYFWSIPKSGVVDKIWLLLNPHCVAHLLVI